MTYTNAILPIPRAVWEFIAHALEDAGYARDQITQIDNALTVALDMTGIGLIPTGDSDICINSGRLSDLMVAIGEEAFSVGFTAGMSYGCDYGDMAGSYYESWSNYEPSDAIQELQGNL